MLERATRLEDFYKALAPEPLVREEDLKKFYQGELNKLRGGDIVARLTRGLEHARGGLPYKALVMGHPGVGKSTEISRLEHTIEGYRVLRIDFEKELSPTGFNPLDVVLILLDTLVRRATQPGPEGAGLNLDETAVRALWEWYAEHSSSLTTATQASASAEAGAGPAGGSPLASLLGLFARLRGEARYAVQRDERVVAHQINRLSDLVRLASDVAEAANRALMASCGQEWLLIGEGFDSPRFDPGLVRQLFVDYGAVIRDLRAHTVFTIPVALGQSDHAPRLPANPGQLLTIPDTPVYDTDKSPYEKGRAALREVLALRVDPACFESGQLERLVVASGGNLRDLFAITLGAAEQAHSLGKERISTDEVDGEILQLRNDYRRRLGENPNHPDDPGYPVKAARLLRVYRRAPEHDIPDPVLYALLRARAVQELNGRRWYGVHPIVVDILEDQGKLERTERDPRGRPRGGTI